MDYEVLLVSQFTLYGSLKGSCSVRFVRCSQITSGLPPCQYNILPSNSNIVSTEPAKEFYNHFLDMTRKMYKSEKIFDGEFGAYMNVELVILVTSIMIG